MKKLIYIILLFSSVLTAQEPYSFSGVDTVLSTSNGYNVFPRSSSHVVDIRNNKFYKSETTGYILLAGDDSYNVANAHNLDDAVIKGNYIEYGGAWASGTVHGIMAGYNVNYDIAYNYFDGIRYSIVHEGGYDDGTPMAHISGGIHGNIIRNCTYTYLWGYDSIRFYNNTVYSSKTDSWPIQIGKSNGTAIPAYAKSVQIVNNIFYFTEATEVLSVATDCDTGLVVDYNVYYCENGIDNKPSFRYKGVGKTFTEWQALGYDEHSVIADPNFVDTINFVPTSRLDYGTNLGTEYDYVLATTSDWVVGTAPDTIQHNGTWQSGAIAYAPNVWYVSPRGDNTNAGTDSSSTGAWETFGKAFNSGYVQPGDTVYFMDGVYYKTLTDSSAWYYPTATSQGGGYDVEIDGTESDMVHFFAYPGATPILDCENVNPTDDLNIGVRGSGYTNYCHFKGLTFRNVWTLDDNDYSTVFWIYGNGTIIENCTFYNSHGIGLRTTAIAGGTFHVTNCDSYNHCDSLKAAAPGNDGYGFGCWNTSFLTGVTYYEGCRAWNCGDDGFQPYSIGYVEFNECWAFNNGQMDGAGNGFKLGYGPPGVDTVNDIRTITNSLALFNKASGFTTNDNDRVHFHHNIYNNLAYKNDHIGFMCYDRDVYEAGGVRRVFRNNIAYNNVADEFSAAGGSITYTSSHNTWDASPSVTVTDADFTGTLDSTTLNNALLSARGSDGSLPSFTYFELESNSDLINAGIDVGLDYYSIAPDIGAFEYEQPGSNKAFRNENRVYRVGNKPYRY